MKFSRQHLVASSLGILLFIFTLATVYLLPATTYAQEKPVNQKAVALRAVVDKYTSHLEKIIDRSENLLDKVQTRIVRERVAGENTVELERLMNESRASVASAEAKLNEVEEMKSTATTKANFVLIRDKFKSAKINLQLAKRDAAEMVSTLKKFNSSN